MGDYRFSSATEAFEDLWLIEDNWDIENQINLYREFSLSPIADQGINSLLEEISSIEENEFSKENTSTPNNLFVQQDSNLLCHNKNTSCASRVEDSNMYFSEQVNSKPEKLLSVSRKGFISKKKEKKSRVKNLETEKKKLVRTDQEEYSLGKKKDHNAKERIRRMKLHESYHALGSLLPMSRTSKKEWTAPVIIDKVLCYIPELETEIKQLTHKKNRIVDENKRLTKKNTESKLEALTVSVNEVKQGEMILQICKKKEHMVDNNGFSRLLRNIEEYESVRVLSASTLRVCDERECYTIHIQMNESNSRSTNGRDYIKEKFVSWLT